MKNYNFKRVVEFYNLLCNSNDFYVCDKNVCHFGCNERERIFSYSLCNVYVDVVLRDSYKHILPNQKDGKCGIFSFINLYAPKLGKDVNKAIKAVECRAYDDGYSNITFSMKHTRHSKQMYNQLVDCIEDLIRQSLHRPLSSYF